VVAGNLVGKVCEGAEDRAGEVFKERDGGSIRPRSSSSGRRRGNWVCVVWLATNQLRFIRLCRLGGTHVLGIGGIKFNQYNS